MNPSVRQIAGMRDPIESIVRRARGWVYRAREAGWAGPPFDPFALADLLAIDVVAVEGVDDARLVHVGRKPRIEFNPSRPRVRVRFSIAHEIGHLLFPDAAEAVRNRSHGARARPDDWEVELLCNVAAAEFLMPVGSLPVLEGDELEINRLMRLRQRFEVSAEALLLRMVQLTPEPAAVFAAARLEADRPQFRIDYSVSGRAWSPGLERGRTVSGGPLAECTAVDYTAKGDARWGEKVHIECVGAPPYPHQRYPRIVGLLRPFTRRARARGISYVDGDATQPRGHGPRVIAHVVNDKTANWGGLGFARALRRAHPEAQAQFRDWGRDQLRLGSSHVADLGEGLYVFSMVAQHGYGPPNRVRLRYGPLEQCLHELGGFAARINASVHMPLIGTGQAGGDWAAVRELVNRAVCDRAVDVTVYLLPGAPLPEEAERQLTLSV